MRSSLALWALAAGLSLGTAGCIKKTLTNGQIGSTRLGSPALDTVADYELARSAASAGLAQFEGMHRLAPDNADALFLLTKGWVGYGYGFVEDEMEQAQDAHDNDLAEYHRRRAKNAYDRAVFYGLELLSKKAEGFDAAKKNEGALKAWLGDHFTDEEDVPNLFWTGYAWLARANLMKDDPREGGAYVSEVWVAAAILERTRQLDPTYNNWAATVALASYHARSAMANPAESKKLFDLALERTQRKSLVVHFNYATKYACLKADKALYEKMLTEVLQAEDPDPMQRLTNTIAKRRAQRWFARARMKDLCAIEKSPPAPPPEPQGPPGD